MKRFPLALSLLVSASALTACAGIIDPNADLDEAVMEDPWMDEARRESTPSGVIGDIPD